MSKRILIVEEETANTILLSDALKQAGYKTIVAADNREAIRCILNTKKIDESFDLIITDIKFPDMTGISLIYGLKKNGLSVPVMVTTNFADKSSIMELVYCGFSELIVKPFMPKDFVERVNHFLFDNGCVENEVYSETLGTSEYAEIICTA